MKIVISGFYGLGNTGDEAILESIIDNLRASIHEPLDITVFSLSPQETAEKHQVKSIYRAWRQGNKEKIQALREANLLISGGGGLLQDSYPTKFLFGPLPYYLIIVLLAKMCGTKVMFFSQGIGPVTSRWGKFLMKIANLADFITVRDQYSKDYLEKLKITKPETVVTSDIVFAFQKKPDTSCIDSLDLRGDEKLSAVSVRPCPWIDDSEHFKKIAKILDELIERKNVTPIFVPMEGHHDTKASEQVLHYMNHRDSCKLLGENFTPNQYMNFIGECELAIGMRLHALIFATLTGVPHVGLSYDKKVESLLKRNGMWPFSTDLMTIDTDKLVANALTLLDNHSKYSQEILESSKIMRREAIRNIELMKENFLK